MIAAPAQARLIVDAGPGTGKTATAAGRIAALAAQGLPPETLWTISFSRAAVGEMRQRLANIDTQISPGRVTTLDSLAWHLRAEDDDDGMVLEGHDRAIEETLAALRAHDPQMMRRIAAIRHFTIDEAQDMVGARALLVVELLQALPPTCGVTILTDEAQAIYGFSASALASSFTADTVARHLLDQSDSPYRLHRLSEVHRTGDPRLLRLFAVARAQAMRQIPNPKSKLARMRRGIAWQAHGRARGVENADTLILYRSRAEVLAAAQHRSDRGQPYRLRLSGLPVMLHPWIAYLLGDYDAGFLPRWLFEDLWKERSIVGDAAQGWAVLAQAIGEPQAERIAMPRLLAVLRTSHPPSELCRFDPGDGTGPVIGTIHASKGREMAHVQLMLPHGKSGGDDPDAEARVLFVGATRAKTRLEVGMGMRLAAKRLPNGRVFVTLGVTSCQVEIGRPGDFDWLDGDHAAIAGLRIGQRLALAFDDGVLRVMLGASVLGIASNALLSDLRDIRGRIAETSDYSPLAARMTGLSCIGQYTLAVDPQVAGKKLPPNYRKTGLLPVPAVSGLVQCDFHPFAGTSDS